MFREETNAMVRQVVRIDSNVNSEEGSLLGLDSVIPGGKYDVQIAGAPIQ